MNSMRLRQFDRLGYVDPRAMLIRLRELEVTVAEFGASDRVRNLRVGELKPIREMREGCIFCYGMGMILGREFLVAQAEEQDYDVVARWDNGDSAHFVPIQIKEVVPTHLNAAASVQGVVDGLRKYTDSRELTVAIHLNQRVQFAPSDIEVPRLNVGGIWVFGATKPDQSQWSIWRLHPNKSRPETFEYPTA
jgi:hypothetical protein